MKQEIQAGAFKIVIIISAITIYRIVPGDALKFFTASISGMLMMAVEIWKTN